MFCGFSADALKGRTIDSDARFVITADGGCRRGSAAALKRAVDEALSDLGRMTAHPTAEEE